MDVFKEDIQLGSKLLPVKIFRTVLEGQCKISAHWHEFVEILYFLEGSAVVQINKQHTHVHPGQIVLLNALDIHSVRGWATYLVLQFEPELANELYIDFIKAFPVLDKDKVLTQPEPCNRHIAEIARNLKEIVEINEEKLPGYEISIRGSIYKIIASMIAYSRENNPDPSRYHLQSKNFKRLESLLSYVDAHYFNDISVQDAAKQLNMSVNYFCRFFKQTMGKTFLEYLNMHRCSKAEGLISTTDRSITDIALSSGFSSISYFNRIYKRYKGLPPSAERRQQDNIVQ